MSECIYLMAGGACAVHSVGALIKEPCLMGPCPDEIIPPEDGELEPTDGLNQPAESEDDND